MSRNALPSMATEGSAPASPIESSQIHFVFLTPQAAGARSGPVGVAIFSCTGRGRAVFPQAGGEESGGF